MAQIKQIDKAADNYQNNSAIMIHLKSVPVALLRHFMVVIASFVFGLTISCSSPSEREKAVDAMDLSLELERFDLAFAEAIPEDLDQLKRRYPLFFPTQYPDSIWVAKIKDTIQIELNEAVKNFFPENANIEDQCAALFKQIKYDFPNFVTPKVATTTSDGDYKSKVIANQAWLILMLDNYLGQDHRFYEGLPRFVAKNLRPEMLFSDVATAFGRKFVATPKDRSFLAQMIYYGKLLYLKDLWLPEMPQEDKIGYTPDELAWAEDNEYFIWQYMLTQEYLYSTNSRLKNRFIDPAPYSKFNLDLDHETPGMIGQWLGWQIVRSYTRHNKISVEDLMNLPAQELFNASHYKPSK